MGTEQSKLHVTRDLGFERQGFNVQECSSRVICFEIEIDFEGQGGVQVCIQLLTLNCEIDEFEERNHQAGAYAPFQSC